MLHQEVFDWLRKRLLVTIDLFASSLSHRCSVYFAPVSDPMAAGTDAVLQSWDSLQAAGAVVGVSSSSSIPVGPPAAAAGQEVSPKSLHASSSCVERLHRCARASGFSRRVACRLGQARRASSIANYQSKWLTYCCWCADKGHSVSNSSVARVADYLVWLWEAQWLSLSSVKAHRSMLSSMFRFKLPELGEHRVLWDLLRSFSIERPRRPQVPPSWDLDIVL